MISPSLIPVSYKSIAIKAEDRAGTDEVIGLALTEANISPYKSIIIKAECGKAGTDEANGLLLMSASISPYWLQ